MWIILFTALDDFGIKELNSGITHAYTLAEIDVVKRKVAEEALQGALRIAGLAGVLTSNGYLVSLRMTWLSMSMVNQNLALVCLFTGTASRPSCHAH